MSKHCSSVLHFSLFLFFTLFMLSHQSQMDKNEQSNASEMPQPSSSSSSTTLFGAPIAWLLRRTGLCPAEEENQPFVGINGEFDEKTIKGLPEQRVLPEQGVPPEHGVLLEEEFGEGSESAEYEREIARARRVVCRWFLHGEWPPSGKIEQLKMKLLGDGAVARVDGLLRAEEQRLLLSKSTIKSSASDGSRWTQWSEWLTSWSIKLPSSELSALRNVRRWLAEEEKAVAANGDENSNIFGTQRHRRKREDEEAGAGPEVLGLVPLDLSKKTKKAKTKTKTKKAALKKCPIRGIHALRNLDVAGAIKNAPVPVLNDVDVSKGKNLAYLHGVVFLLFFYLSGTVSITLHNPVLLASVGYLIWAKCFPNGSGSGADGAVADLAPE